MDNLELQIETLCCLADSAFEMYEYERSINLLSEVIELAPNFSNAFSKRGISYYFLDDYPNAIQDLSYAIELNPSDWSALNFRGLTKVELNDFQSAIQDYTKAIKVIKNKDFIFSNRGIAKKSINDLQGAIEDFTKAIGLNINNDEAFYWRGISKGIIDDYVGAISDFSEVIKLNPNGKQAIEQKLYYESKLEEINQSILKDANENVETFLFIGWEVYMELPLDEQNKFENYDHYEFYIDGGLPNIRKMSGEDWDDDECFEDTSDFEDFWGISYQKKCGYVYLRKYKNWSAKEERYFRDLADKFDGDQIRIKER